MVYNSSEQNSVIQLKEIKKVAKEFNIEIIEKSVTLSELPQTVSALISSSDAIYTIADNLVASSIPVISDLAIKDGKLVSVLKKLMLMVEF